MILVGDCIEVMRTLDANSVDSIVTDPPYGIGFMGKAWDGKAIVERHARRDSTEEARQRNGLASAAGTYDLTPKAMRAFQDFSADWGLEALRVAKPGAYCVAFASPRTFHRMVCGLEEAGWEIRDTLMWIFGSGFPKSHNGEWGGTALKPAWEPIVLARKPLEGTVEANWRTHGTGALNIDGCRIESEGGQQREGEPSKLRRYTEAGGTNFAATPGPRGGDPMGRWPANLIHDGSEEVVTLFPSEAGAAAPVRRRNSDKFRSTYGAFSGQDVDEGGNGFQGDSGSAARFFYCAKASRSDRNDGCDGLPLKTSGMVSNTSGQHMTRRDGGAPAPAANNHPTVKPTALLRWLLRLVTPPGGTTLDCFGGSGSGAKAAVLEGFEYIWIDKDEDEDGNPLGYADITVARVAAAKLQRADELERARLETMQMGLPLGNAA
jgi:site-specific DNA-methyltransferase (adenine-specific)